MNPTDIVLSRSMGRGGPLRRTVTALLACLLVAFAVTGWPLVKPAHG